MSCTNKQGNSAPRKNSGNDSAPTTPLTAPTLSTPTSNPYTSADEELTISGGCSNGSTVYLTGSATDSELCSGGSYNFIVPKTTDGDYSFAIYQTDTNGKNSDSTTLVWTKNSSVPPTPVIMSPSQISFSSSGNSLVISGTCTDTYTVELGGSATDSQTCGSNAFSFTVTTANDGSYAYTVRQKNLLNVYSGTASLTWSRDTVAPSAPSVTSPTANPTISAATTLTLSGVCESGGTVYVSGSATTNVGCVGGTYSVNITKSTDGTYNFNLLQKDLAGNSSSSTAFSWLRDTASPDAPTVVSPSSPHSSNTNSITITGGCQSQATVTLSGDATASSTCTLNSYSLTVSKTTDGTYNFNLIQTDLAGNNSASTNFVWKRDTVSPNAVTVINPSSNPFSSSENDITISGVCESGATVALSGADTQTATCTSDGYLFNSSKGADGTYNYTLIQTDPAGNASTSTSFTWNRNSAVPGMPTIDAPTTRPYSSNGNSVNITGQCETGNTVEISGDASASTTCSSSSYTLTVTANVDGIYNYTIRQKSPTDVYSPIIGLQWTRDTVAPSAPSVTSPSTNPKYSNSSSLVIAGACESGATVNLSGAATDSTACSSSSFNFVVNKIIDGSYAFSITQTDLAGNISAAVSKTWFRDTVAPSVLTLTSPSTNPLVSGDTNITIGGTCEPNAVIALSGATNNTTSCTPVGAFSFNVSKSSDGGYNFSLLQTDAAGNSSASLDFQWVRDTSVPSTPVITAPAVYPYLSNQNTLTITASCNAALSPSQAVVTLSGDLTASDMVTPAGSLSQTCTSSPVTFVIQKSTDSTYNFSVIQQNPNAGTSSSAAAVQWIRDTVAPSVPTITTPIVSPFTAPGNLTLSGACEANATVYLTGADTQNTTCNSGAYNFTVNKSSDGTYNFTLFQTDLAGNSSGNQTFQWVRDSNSVQPPVITTPAVSSVTSNASFFVISGSCTTGYLLTLSGNVSAPEVTSPTNTLTQTCVGGTFSYVISVSADGTRTFNLTQSYNAVTSTAVSIQWVRDTVAPVTTISATPENPNISISGTFGFSSNEAGSTFECKLDTGSYASCLSPLTYPSFTNGNRTFYVRSIDSAGNVSAEQSFGWTQAAYNTAALYHLDTATPLSDSSLYTQGGVVNQDLTASGSTSNDTSGYFNNSRGFGTNISLSKASTNILNNAVGTVTIEGFFKISTTISSAGQYYTLVAKSGAASPNLGWEIRLRKSNASKYVLDFVSSQNGTSSTTVSTSNLTVATGTWSYFAVTWNKGQTKIYFGSTTAKATSGTVGTSTLFASSGDLTLGKGPSTGTGSALWFAGSLDEVRISQVVRTISIPTAPFNED